MKCVQIQNQILAAVMEQKEACKSQYHPTADTNGVPVYADWNAPFLVFLAFLAELYSNVKVYYSETM